MIEQKLQSKVQPREVSAHQRIPAEHTGSAVRQAHLLTRQRAHRARRSSAERIALAKRQTRNIRERRPGFKSANHLSERDVAFAPDDHVRSPRGILVDLQRQARVVAADDDRGLRAQPADQRGDTLGGTALKRHDRQPDDVRLQRADQPLHGGPNAPVGEDQIPNRHGVVRVEIAGQRPERTIRHPRRDDGRVLE
jgi:hypothetical protein